jgi:hypothetical protein
MAMAVVVVTLLPFSHAHYLFYNQTNCNKKQPNNSLQKKNINDF